jgi:hypothetical protein
MRFRLSRVKAIMEGKQSHGSRLFGERLQWDYSLDREWNRLINRKDRKKKRIRRKKVDIMPRGRFKSQAQLDSRPAPGAVMPGERPNPPDRMGSAEVEIWDRVVGAMPGGWFGPECHDLLARYCEIMARAEGVGRKLSELARQKDVIDRNGRSVFNTGVASANYREDLKTAAMLATTLRITPKSRLSTTKAQSLYDGSSIANRVARSTAAVRPWEITAGNRSDDEDEEMRLQS